jgi:hypothetical protein
VACRSDRHGSGGGGPRIHSGGHRGSPVGFGRQTSTETEDRTMTDAMMSLCTLLEKSSDADLLREMVGFAAQRLMELEVESLTGAAHGERSPGASITVMATETGSGRPAPGRSSGASQSCARAATSRGSWNRGGWPRKRWPRLSRRLTCTACRRARSMIWSKPWA